MSDIILNHVADMISNRSCTVKNFGKDQTGTIDYDFNSQGFRGCRDFVGPADFAFFGGSLVFGIGVPETQIFPYLFQNSHNYGLAGRYYDNHDTMKILQKFLNSDLCAPSTQIFVVWHSRDADCLTSFYEVLKLHDIKHFFCGTNLGFQNCFNAPANLDTDVSGTHPGPRTHKFWYRVCKSLAGN